MSVSSDWDHLADQLNEAERKNAFELLMAKVKPHPLVDYDLYDSEDDLDDFSDDELSISYSDAFTALEWRSHSEIGCHARENFTDPDISFEEFEKHFHDKYYLGERAFRDCWFSREWEIWARPSFYHESHYLDAQKPRRNGPGAIIVYDKCEEKDLKRFVLQRGLKDPYPAGVTMKYYYIRILDQADREWNFPLMDLPPEMRLSVYRHLLLFPGPQQMASAWNHSVDPAILRTSKLVNREASPVLYEDNLFSVHFEVTARDNGRSENHARVHVKHVYSHCDHLEFFRLPVGIDDYPDFFRRITRLHIHITYSVSGSVGVPADGAWPLNHLLYSLASFLMDGHQLKSLHLKVDVSEQMERFRFPMIFYPLRRLRNIPNLTIEGNLPEFVARKLQADLNSSEPVFNTLRYWKLLYDETMEQMGLFEVVEVPCNCGDCLFSQSMHVLASASEFLFEVKKESCFGSQHEERFIARLNDLRKVLDRLDMDEIASALKKIKQMRQEKKQYESVTDDGRLQEAGSIWKGKLLGPGLPNGAEDEDWETDEEATSTDDNKAEMPSDHMDGIDYGSPSVMISSEL